MSLKFITPTSFDASKLVFGDAIVNAKNKSKLIPVRYEGHPLVLKVDKRQCSTVWDFHEDSNKATVELALQTTEDPLRSMLEAFDIAVIEHVHARSADFFKKTFNSVEAVKHMYTHSIREPPQPNERGWPPVFKTSVYRGADGNLDLTCYDGQRDECNLSSVNDLRYCDLMMIVTCSGIRFIGNNNFSVTWKVSMLRFFPRPRAARQLPINCAPVNLTNPDMESIKLAAPKQSNVPSMRNAYVNFNDGPLVIQTPYMHAPYGISAWTGDEGASPKFSLELSFRDMESDPAVKSLHEFISKLEAKVRTQASTWVKSAPPELTSVIKQSNPGYPACFRINVPATDGVVNLDAYYYDADPVDLRTTGLKVVSGAKVSAKIVCTCVWINGARVGVSFKALSINIVPDVRTQGCLLDDDEEDAESVNNGALFDEL